MSALLLRDITKERAMHVLDWTVFSIGALSLTIAIAATVLSNFDLLGSQTAYVPQEIVVTPLPDVL